MAIAVRRVYEPPAAADGLRVLVDRLWPRGLSRSRARIDVWAKELSPSNALRKWYAHDARKWPEFRRRYFAELKGNAAALQSLSMQARRRKVTLLFGSREPRLNNAFALKQALETRARRRKPSGKAARPTRRKRPPH
jgi:uncharacterized protein YeaO (DUF488 family)